MWLEFDEQTDGSYIVCADERYFVASANDGKQFISPAICSHRGGPLHMGKTDGKSKCIRCPWHGLSTSESSIERRCLPAVRVGTKWKAKLPDHVVGDKVIVMPLPTENAGRSFI